MSKKILIVGGVAGGATVATRLRRLDEEAQIILFERGGFGFQSGNISVKVAGSGNFVRRERRSPVRGGQGIAGPRKTAPRLAAAGRHPFRVEPKQGIRRGRDLNGAIEPAKNRRSMDVAQFGHGAL